MTFINNFKKKQYWALVRLLLANFYFSHLIATALIAMSLLHDYNWMVKFQIQNEDWFVKYYYSFYWSAAIVVTVGFGDITVANFDEAMIVAIIVLIGCMLLSFNISQVGTIISNLRSADSDLRNELAVLKRLAAITNIN